MLAKKRLKQAETVGFADLIDMNNPQQVREEVHYLLTLMFPHFDFAALDQMFADVLLLFQGRYPGYRACNTRYHDLKHTTDCFLALARLIHGASVDGLKLGPHPVFLGLASSLLHDTGYIQTSDDLTGTGGKYTLNHVERSIAFMEQYLLEHGYSNTDREFCRLCLKCTDLNVHLATEVHFLNKDNEILGKMLGTADLLGQMADRTYLEKLPSLYREFAEAGVPGFGSELELMEKTPAFWEFTQKRLATELDNMDRFMRPHFRVRWGIDRDLNREMIEANIAYLKKILKTYGPDYHPYLRRRRLARILPRRSHLRKTLHF